MLTKGNYIIYTHHYIAWLIDNLDFMQLSKIVIILYIILYKQIRNFFAPRRVNNKSLGGK